MKNTDKLIKAVYRSIKDLPKHAVDNKSISNLMSNLMALCVDQGLEKLKDADAKQLFTVAVMIYDKFLHAPPETLKLDDQKITEDVLIDKLNQLTANLNKDVSSSK